MQYNSGQCPKSRKKGNEHTSAKKRETWMMIFFDISPHREGATHMIHRPSQVWSKIGVSNHDHRLSQEIWWSQKIWRFWWWRMFNLAMELSILSKASCLRNILEIFAWISEYLERYFSEYLHNIGSNICMTNICFANIFAGAWWNSLSLSKGFFVPCEDGLVELHPPDRKVDQIKEEIVHQ